MSNTNDVMELVGLVDVSTSNLTETADTNSRYVNVGSNWNNTDNAGTFNWNSNNTVDNSNNNIGSRLISDLNMRYESCPPPHGGSCLMGDTMTSINPINDFRDLITLERLANISIAREAHRKARRGKKKHYKQVIEFEKDLDNNLQQLVDEFKNGTYRTSGYTLAIINDGRKEREVAKVCYKDRVAQWMIALLYSNYLLDLFHPNTHAAIKGKGIHTALQQTVDYTQEYDYCLKIDINKYFPSINRTVLKEQMEVDFLDSRVRKIVCDIIDDAPKTGIPIGNYLSQFLANRYLTSFDYWMDHPFVRYMDDIVIFGNSREELMKVLREVEWYLRSHLFLTVKDNWQIFKIEDRGIDFVGYRIWKDRVILRKTTFIGLRQKLLRIRDLATEYNRCVTMSYLGWINPCSLTDRLFLYDNYFKYKLQNTTYTKKMRRYYVHFN